MKRKGDREYHWEEMITLPNLQPSPSFLLKKYAMLTHSQGKPGGALFLSLQPPFKALSANSIGRITKDVLRRHGVSTETFGPHSTRGAGVFMYKSLGLPSEQVCELGRWKNVEAFSKHYLRIGAASSAGKALSQAHNVSPGGSAESDRSQTPRTDRDSGGSDREDGAQSTGEPTHPPGMKRPRSPTPMSAPNSPPRPSRLLFRFAAINQPL